jgi:hypothetical protein
VLLSATISEHPGIFDHTSFVQRLHTIGGKSPAVNGTEIGQVAKVPYTAGYFFYRNQDN